MRFRGVQRTDGQVVIDTPFLRDASLTCKAKGLLAVLYSWPVGAPVTITAILELTCDGRDAVTKAWAELEKAGYLVSTNDGLQIAENRNPQTVAVTGNREKPLVRVSVTVPGSFVSGGKSEARVNGTRIAENHESVLGDFSEKQQKRNLGALREIAKRHGTGSRKIANAVDDPGGSALLEREHPEGSLNDDAHPATLFGAGVDENAETIFRTSAIGKWEVFKSTPTMREAELKGIDVPYYFRRLLGWSNKLSTRVAKNRRTAHGWLSTAQDWMEKDLEQGRLRTVAGKAADDEALMEFLKLGR